MVRAIREYLKRTGIKVGFKPAGGIRTAKDSLAWLSLMKEELGTEWTKVWTYFYLPWLIWFLEWLVPNRRQFTFDWCWASTLPLLLRPLCRCSPTCHVISWLITCDLSFIAHCNTIHTLIWSMYRVLRQRCCLILLKLVLKLSLPNLPQLYTSANRLPILVQFLIINDVIVTSVSPINPLVLKILFYWQYLQSATVLVTFAKLSRSFVRTAFFGVRVKRRTTTTLSYVSLIINRVIGVPSWIFTTALHRRLIVGHFQLDAAEQASFDSCWVFSNNTALSGIEVAPLLVVQ